MMNTVGLEFGWKQLGIKGQRKGLVCLVSFYAFWLVIRYKLTWIWGQSMTQTPINRHSVGLGFGWGEWNKVTNRGW